MQGPGKQRKEGGLTALSAAGATAMSANSRQAAAAFSGLMKSPRQANRDQSNAENFARPLNAPSSAFKTLPGPRPRGIAASGPGSSQTLTLALPSGVVDAEPTPSSVGPVPTPTGSVASNAASVAAATAALANKSIQVLVRVRPANAREISSLGAEANGDGLLRIDPSGAVVVTQPGVNSRQFNFDAVFPRNTSQASVFDHAGRPVVDSCLAGFHGTVLAYGQTGSGKTHTMFGPTLDAAAVNAFARAGGDNDHRGLIPRILSDIFDRIRAEAGTSRTFECRCSFLEIYNERIIDLLAPPTAAGPGADGGNDNEVVIRHGRAENLIEKPISSVEDALSFLRVGNANRHLGSTLMNAKSSRSHSLFTLTISSRRTSDYGAVISAESRLTLVDLAGSECAKTTGATGAQLKEASNINKSLSALGMMLRALVMKQQHIPYRDSKLTRLLRDSIGGNNKLCLIANVSPSPSNAQETVTTLNFASDARHLPNKAIAQTVTESAPGTDMFARAMGGDAAMQALLTTMHTNLRAAFAEQARLSDAVGSAELQLQALLAVRDMMMSRARGKKRASDTGSDEAGRVEKTSRRAPDVTSTE